MLITRRIHKGILLFRMSPVRGKHLFSDTDEKGHGRGKQIFNISGEFVSLFLSIAKSGCFWRKQKQFKNL